MRVKSTLLIFIVTLHWVISGSCSTVMLSIVPSLDSTMLAKCEMLKSFTGTCNSITPPGVFTDLLWAMASIISSAVSIPVYSPLELSTGKISIL